MNKFRLMQLPRPDFDADPPVAGPASLSLSSLPKDGIGSPPAKTEEPDKGVLPVADAAADKAAADAKVEADKVAADAKAAADKAAADAASAAPAAAGGQKPKEPTAEEAAKAAADKVAADAQAMALLKHTAERHEKVMKFLEENHPDVRDEYKGTKPKTPDAPAATIAKELEKKTPEEIAAEEAAEEQRIIADLTADMNPEQQKAFFDKLKKTVRSEWVKLQEEEGAKTAAQRLADERGNARVQAAQFLFECDPATGEPIIDKTTGEPICLYPADILAAAHKEVRSLHINVNEPGGPMAYLRAMANHVKYLVSERTKMVVTADIAAAEAAKQKQNLLATQPGGGTLPAPKDLTFAEKELAAVEASGGNPIGKLLDSKKKMA